MAARPGEQFSGACATAMMIRFQCEGCNRPVHARAEMAGRAGNCPECGHQLTVPSSRSAERTLPAGKQSLAVDDDPDATPDPPASGGEGSVQRTDEAALAAGLATRTVASLPHERSRTRLRGAGSSRIAARAEGAMLARQVAGPPATSFDPINEVPKALWYVRPPTGGQFGPASAPLFRQWLNEDRVTADSWIWRQGWEDWVPAGSLFPELDGSGLVAADKGPVSVARIRSIYLRARRRRTMWTTIGLVAGTLAAGLLILALVYLAQIS